MAIFGDSAPAAPRLERPRDGRLLAGVCAALADGYAVDVTLVRLSAVLLALASGIGVVLYLVGWLLIRDEKHAADNLRQVVGGNISSALGELQETRDTLQRVWQRSGRDARWPRPLSRRWIALAMIGAGALLLLQSLGVFGWLGTARLVALAVIALGIGVLATQAPQWRR